MVWAAGLNGVSIEGAANVGGVGSSGPARQEPTATMPKRGADPERDDAVAQHRTERRAKAQARDARSQRQPETMYYLGQGINIEYATAYETLSNAANQRDDVAQLTLGVMYNDGQAVPKSRDNA